MTKKSKKNKSLRGLSTIEPSAFAFAKHFHGDQMYGQVSYMKHLAQAVYVYRRHETDPLGHLVDSIWLHDVLEDTDCKPQYITEYFGEKRGRKLRTIVELVTDNEGSTRKERHRNTYPTLAGNNNAVVVKLCDRIANVEQSILTKSGFLKMYKKEYPYFRKTLSGCTREPNASLWEHLDELMQWTPQD